MDTIIPFTALKLSPLIWACLAVFCFRRNLSFRLLFFISVALASFGIQSIVTGCWPFFQIASGAALEKPLRTGPRGLQEMAETQLLLTLEQSAIALIVAVSFSWWLATAFRKGIQVRP